MYIYIYTRRTPRSAGRRRRGSAPQPSRGSRVSDGSDRARECATGGAGDGHD